MSIRSASVSRRRRGRHAIPQLREKILLSALELFADNGFEKVTADELAAGRRWERAAFIASSDRKRAFTRPLSSLVFASFALKLSACSIRISYFRIELPRSFAMFCPAFGNAETFLS
jgi:hypothetical protein